MKVKKLIEKLSALDPELNVFIEGYEAGYDLIDTDFEVNEYVLNVHTEWYYGDHDLAELYEEHESLTKVKGICIK